MGEVVRFRGRHARTSTTSRAAKRASKSAVMPAERAFSVSRIGDQYSDGIRSRCHHFVTTLPEAPTSEPSADRAPCASFGPQSSITSRNELKSAMGAVLGQIVLNCKDNLALDVKKSLGHTVRMAESDAKAQYEQEFIGRVKAARIATGKKQWQIAELMGIKQDQYKHYEIGRVIPHHLIGRFCLICNIDPNWLLTGKGAKPLQPPHVIETEEPAPKAVSKPKKARRSKAA